MTRRCSKGKSCGATCIQRAKWCELELGPKVSKSLTQAQKRIGVLGLFAQVRGRGIKGYKAKFDAIRKELKGELGHQIRKTEDVQELQKRLQKAGLLSKDEKSKTKPKTFNVDDLFAKPKKEETKKPGVLDINQILAGAGQKPATAVPPAQEKTKTTPNTKDINDDISRILRGESPKYIQPTSGFQAPPTGASQGPTTGNTKWAREDAGDFDKAFKIYKRIKGENATFDWDESARRGIKIGEGSYGTVLRVGDVAVKRGNVSGDEAEILKTVGKAGLGPRLLMGEMTTRKYGEYGVDIHEGRIAMSLVPGKPMGLVAPDKQIGGKNVADIYWKAMAGLHRLGIAHNDAHIDNLLIDNKGVGRWVDLGLAQANPKAALAEAMGIFDTLKNAPFTRTPGAYGQGNWQTRKWDATGYRQAYAARQAGGKTWDEFVQRFPVASRIWENKADAQYRLMKMGLTRPEVSAIIDHGIRSSKESYNQGPWAKLTDKQALEVLNILYDGV